MTKRDVLLTVLVLLTPLRALGDGLLEDRSGDGVITYAGFGDSITYGVGDGAEPGVEDEIPFTDGSLGYLSRLRTLLNIKTVNLGVPGEVFTEEGIFRLPQEVQGSGTDLVGIFEGINDANFQITESRYSRTLQKAINVTAVSGKTPLLLTLPAPCCEHSGLRPISDAYNRQIRRLATVNDLTLVDLERAWRTSCEDPVECELYHLPEGLHPNTKGYDVLAQTVAGSLVGVNVFEADGAQQLADALGIDKNDVVVKPGE
jgi:lysophospholipase L1-like esterase